MHIESIDPRDVSTEQDQPIFRVHFWWSESLSGSDGAPSTYVDEFEVHDADIKEVLDWAERDRMARQFVLYLVTTDSSGERHSHRLAGQLPQ